MLLLEDDGTVLLLLLDVVYFLSFSSTDGRTFFSVACRLAAGSYSPCLLLKVWLLVVLLVSLSLDELFRLWLSLSVRIGDRQRSRLGSGLVFLSGLSER